MKKRIISFVLMVMALIFIVSSCTQPAKQTSDGKGAFVESGISAENAQYWRETLQKYRNDSNVNQIMLVRYTGGCSAKVYFYEKIVNENDVWSLVFEEDDAYVGKNGIDKVGEGDAKTPTADLGVLRAFGIRNNPGTALEYIDVTPDIYACDEECEYYNKIINTKLTGHDCEGEEMFKYTPEYNYGFETDFNAECVQGAGSAIFVHCKGAKAFTGGCIALDEEHVIEILKRADSGMRVVIGED